MIAPLAKLIEWASVQETFTKMRHPGGNLGLDEASAELGKLGLKPLAPIKNAPMKTVLFRLVFGAGIPVRPELYPTRPD